MRVHAALFDPNSSYFKAKANDRAEYVTVNCSRASECDLHSQGTCVLVGLRRAQHCPYGTFHKEEGPTKRSNKCGSWVAERRSVMKDAPRLKAATLDLARIGGFVYVNYPFMSDLLKTVFVPVAEFTVDRVIELCEFKPRAYGGGEIVSYQLDTVPRFVAHLATKFPELYQQVCVKYPRAKTLLGNTPNVGRKAYLKTLKPNVGVFRDLHAQSWRWDGEFFVSCDVPYVSPLEDVKEVKLRPGDKAVVIVTEEAQVTVDTVFVT